MCCNWQSSHKKFSMNGNDPTKDLISMVKIFEIYIEIVKKLVEKLPKNNRKLAKIPLSLNVT